MIVPIYVDDAKGEKDRFMVFHMDNCTVLSVTQKKNPFHHNHIFHNICIIYIN